MKHIKFLIGALTAFIPLLQAQTVYTENFDSFTVTSSSSAAHELGGASPEVTYGEWFSSNNYVNDTGTTLNFTSDGNANRTRGAGVWLDTTGWTPGTVTVTFDISGFVASTGTGSGSVIQAYTASGVDATNAAGVDIHGNFSGGVVLSGTATSSPLGGATAISANGTSLTHTFIYSGQPEICLTIIHQAVAATGTTAAFSIDNLSASIGPTPVTPITKPNIILFYVDDLGWQDTELNDLDTPCPYETPNLKALAAAGMNFSNAYSPAPTCAPSRGAIITGQHPAKTRFTHVTTNDTSDGDPANEFYDTYIDKQLDPTLLTTADALKANGYSTGHSGKWHVGLTAASYGFDTVNHSRGVHRGMNPHRNAASAFGGTDSNYPLSTEKYAPTSAAYPTGISYPYDEVTESALQFIADEKDEPFFLQVWHWMVHYPIVTRNEDLLKYYCTKLGHSYPPAIDDDTWATTGQTNPYFAAMVTTVDWSLGRLVDYLTITDDPRHPGKKLIETTYIVFTSDNGGAEVREGGGTIEYVSENEPLRGKKGNVTDGGIRVPMVFSGPEITAGSEFHTMVSQLDYFPTFLSLTDTTIAQSDKDELCGADLEPILHGTSTQVIEPTTMQEREFLFWHFPHYQTMYAALRSGDYKLHKSFKTGAYELYRLTNNGVRTDIEEAVDLAGDPAYAAKLAELKVMLEGALLSKDAEIPYLNPLYTGRTEPVAIVCPDSFQHSTRQALQPIDPAGPKIVEASVIYRTPLLNPGDNEVVTDPFMGGMRQAATVSADGYSVSAVIPSSIDSYAFMLVDENGFMQYTDEVNSAEIVMPTKLAHWSLDEASGVTATDSTGNGHDASVTGANWSMGVENGALYFDGATDVASIPSSAFTSITNQVSIALWAYGGSSQPVNDTAFYAADSSNGKLLNIHLPWGNSNVFWDAGANNRVTASISGDDIKGKWNHWVFTKDSAIGSMKIYLNGSLLSSELTGNTESLSGITQAWLGGSGGLGSPSYEGLLDEVSLYGVALSDAEVATLYDGYTQPVDYQEWLLNYPNLTNNAFNGDPDQDGIETGLEYALGGSPVSIDNNLHPCVSETATHYVFTYTRRVKAIPDTVQTFQYGSDLNNWTNLNITEPRASEVSFGPILNGLQEVTVSLPKSLYTSEESFFRLKVDQ